MNSFILYCFKIYYYIFTKVNNFNNFHDYVDKNKQTNDTYTSVKCQTKDEDLKKEQKRIQRKRNCSKNDTSNVNSVKVITYNK